MSGAAARTGSFINNRTKIIAVNMEKRLLQNNNESDHKDEKISI